jgi:hypothetical protein
MVQSKMADITKSKNRSYIGQNPLNILTQDFLKF